MDNKGWISLHRKFQEHWLWNEKRVFSKAEAWIDILLKANHNEAKIILGNEIIIVKRGSFITSELKLMQRWKWSKSKLRSFLLLLERDKMIIKKTDSKKTTVTVVKYNDYQVLKTTKEPQKDCEQTANGLQKDTNNNDNKDNNDNNKKNSVFNFRKNLIDLGAKEELVIDWLKVRKTKKSTNTKTAFNSFKKQFELSNKDINEILEICITKSWAGFKNEWILNKEKKEKLTGGNAFLKQFENE